jgi:hypothetical protein
MALIGGATSNLALTSQSLFTNMHYRDMAALAAFGYEIT